MKYIFTTLILLVIIQKAFCWPRYYQGLARTFRLHFRDAHLKGVNPQKSGFPQEFQIVEAGNRDQPLPFLDINFTGTGVIFQNEPFTGYEDLTGTLDLRGYVAILKDNQTNPHLEDTYAFNAPHQVTVRLNTFLKRKK